ncbi:MAG: signal peptidase I [Myxococcales bacterium]|nr:signal peptidase I [Myxococcales bacterium]
MSAKKRAKSERQRKKQLAELDEIVGWLLRDSKRLLKRHGNRIAPDARTEIGNLREQLEHVCEPKPEQRDLVAVKDACDALDRALDRYMARWRKSPTREYIEAIMGAVILALVIRAFVFEAFKIPTGSMIPTLHVHDHLFVNKFLYGLKIPFTRIKFLTFRKPIPGEVIVFEYPYDDDPDSAGKDLIKRVVATAGDRVRLVNNHIQINGKPIGRELVVTAGDCGEAVEHIDTCPDDPKRWCLWAGTVDGSLGGQIIRRFPSKKAALDKIREVEGFGCTQHLECLSGTKFVAQFRQATPGSDNEWGASLNDPNWPPKSFDALRFTRSARRYLPAENKDFPDFVIPEGFLLVMGDNRDNSKDGRYFGLVPLDTVKGKAGFIWYAYERHWYIPDFSRIGQLVHQDGTCKAAPAKAAAR